MPVREQSRRIREAYQLGLLDPVLEILDDHMGRTRAPKEPEGPEWPYRRAFLDGRMHEAESLRRWILGLANPSTDGSENTEDQHE